jgi:cytochrome d ubiquinol oxidase subunit II
MAAIIFITAFGTLALSIWPYMIPFAIMVDQAAAPHSSSLARSGARVCSCFRR